jgi:hypothetical protein
MTHQEAAKKSSSAFVKEISEIDLAITKYLPSPDYRSRFPRKVAALLERQSQGKYLNNTQKRMITLWQRQQLLQSISVQP